MALRTERDPPYAFAGRKAEIGSLGERLERVRRTRRSTAGLALVEGIPGIGKTTLLDEVGTRFTARDNCVLHVPLLLEALDNDRNFIQAFFERLEPKTRKYFGGVVQGLSVNSLGSVTFAPSGETTLMEVLNDVSKSAWWRDKTVLITIDEVQNAGRQHERILNLLHKGFGENIPILAVCAGLSTSTSALSDIGISRLAGKIALDCLSSEEAREAFIEGLDAALKEEGLYEARATLDEAIDFDAIIVETDSFPAHITTAIRSAVHHVRARERLNTNDVKHTITKQRMRYYASQLNSARIPPEVLAPLMGALQQQQAITRTSLEGFIRKMPVLLDAPNRETARDEVIYKLMRAGVIQQHPETGRFSTGIPSMSTYVLELGHSEN